MGSGLVKPGLDLNCDASILTNDKSFVNTDLKQLRESEGAWEEWKQKIESQNLWVQEIEFSYNGYRNTEENI